MHPWMIHTGKDSHRWQIRDMRMAFLRPHLWETCLQRKTRWKHQRHPRHLLCGRHWSFLPDELTFRRRIPKPVNGHCPVKARVKGTNGFQPRVLATPTQLRDCGTRRRAWERHPAAKDHYRPSAMGIRRSVSNTPAANWTWGAMSQSHRLLQEQG